MISTEDFYIEQRKDYGVGNFINCTPTIKTLSDHFGKPVNVYFASSHVKELFLNCPFIKPISLDDTKLKETLFSTSLTNKNLPDYKFIFWKIIKDKLNLPYRVIPHTYVDQCQSSLEINNPYVVIIRGGVRNEWFEMKDPGAGIYKRIIKILQNKYLVIQVGSKRDKDLLDEIGTDYVRYLDNIRQVVSLIQNASFVVANDTGLYHVAGALNKEAFVLWKNTNFKKNRSPGKKCFYSQKDYWLENFNK